MVHKLFEDFLDNPEQYRACERYWSELVKNVARSLGQIAEWKRWTPRPPIDLDLLPIFDARSDTLDRAFRVLQYPSSEDRVLISAWVKSYQGNEYRDTIFPRMGELFINLCLSEESARLAEGLLRKWMTPETTIDEIELFIQDNLPPLEH